MITDFLESGFGLPEVYGGCLCARLFQGYDCPIFRWPITRAEFWHKKIGGNADRDLQHKNAVLVVGWRVGVVWECALKGKFRLEPGRAIDSVARWLSSDATEICIRGRV